ncbi:MAG: aspartate--tRNA ligase [Rhodospirillaceae bacterium]|nr:aspartate--tRNA ligase [Rhodospirillaceae bacterium]
MHPYRTHNCGELNRNQIGQKVRLSGWVHSKRDHGNLLFIDLRDQYGMTQSVVETDSDMFNVAEDVRIESVITITGEVVERSEETVNHRIPTGQIEVTIKDFRVESSAETLPMQVSGGQIPGEDIRLKYRFLDLRREQMQRNIRLRSNIITNIRKHMVEQGFMEFQTPILTSSSPEGARDYLVPSRVHPGQFYALPQAPQQFKQLIMVSGFDRYFQIAPCFRDEDARADRSPGEFYQLDMEMAFATQEDVFEAIEPVLYKIFSEFSPWEVTKPPFPRIAFRDSMLLYGTDKPDLRNPLLISDVTEYFNLPHVTFKAFRKQIEKGGIVRAIPGPGTNSRPRSFFDKLNEWARSEGAPGLGYVTFDDSGLGKGPISKFIPHDVQEKLKSKMGIGPGDTVFFVCDEPSAAEIFAGRVRTRLGNELDLLEKQTFRMSWTVDFPMYEKDSETGEIKFSHNPFSMPQGGNHALETQDPLDLLAYQYDIVCNGVELSSGAIRNHQADTMIKAFGIAGYSKEEVEEKFGGMLRAFRFGAPPHGGLAPGIDRMVMLIANEPNIREVTLFPMNQQAQDLLMDAPSEVTSKQLKELFLSLRLPPKEDPEV